MAKARPPRLSAHKRSFAQTHWAHHARFYIAFFVGLCAYGLTGDTPLFGRFAAAGNGFFLAYLIASVLLIISLTPATLKKRAEMEDEGIIIVLVIVLAVIMMSVVSIFAILNQSDKPHLLTLIFAAANAPLAWLKLHTITAFHYANLYYSGGEGRERASLDFPGTDQPGIGDFLYFSFVVGMTAQVSDVQVRSSAMRRSVLWHSILSFFFNTVLLAMAVNAVISVS